MYLLSQLYYSNHPPVKPSVPAATHLPGHLRPYVLLVLKVDTASICKNAVEVSIVLAKLERSWLVLHQTRAKQ